ncbi:TPA: ABC transporter ATP-binding protein, partial [Candidatus Aciduliprofundum boonei]|nr:ABC transporter ATP-binding protein [Candidatus Aciduliprofundum boonei]
MISVHSLNKWYENKHVLKDLNLEVKKGEVFGLLGPNGAGKTTLIKVLTGQTPAKGRIRVAGVDPLKEPIKVRELVGIVPENESVPNYLTVEEYLYFVAKIRKLDNSAVDRMIED